MTDHEPRRPGEDDDSELDRRIRDLVARAVDDSPFAPDIVAHDTGREGEDGMDGGVAVITNETGTATDARRRLMIRGAAGLSIAAALVAILLFARPEEVAGPVIPATVPDTGATPAATTEPVSATTEAPATVVPTTEPIGSSEPVPSSDPTISSPTTSPTDPVIPTTEPVLAPAGRADVRVRSGPDGVEILDPEARTVTTEPMAVARLGADGAVYAQRSDDVRDTSADTSLLRIDDGPPNPVPIPTALDRPLRLHDGAVIDGATVLLVEGGAENCDDPQLCVGVLYAFRPDDGELDQIDRMNVWEAGWEQLSLSETGVIVGGTTNEAVRSPYVATIPGAEGPVPDVADLGLADEYVDCNSCPQGFAIDRRGERVSWVTYGSDETATATVTVVDVVNGDRRAVDVSGVDRPIVPVTALGIGVDTAGATTDIVVINEIYRDLAVYPNAGTFAPVSVDVATGAIDLGAPDTIETFE